MQRQLAYTAILFVAAVFASCAKSNLTHERYIHNNTADDTIIVINPDFDDSKDTIPPGEMALIYSFEVLDTQQEFEPCMWLGDTLIIKNQNEEHLTRSVKVESFWTYTIQGERERLQQCTFTIVPDDF